MDEKRKVAWVIGGSSGLGLSIAQSLLERNYQVVIFGRDEEKLAAAAKQISTGQAAVASGNVGIRSLDVTLDSAVQAGFEQQIQIDGRLDVLVNVVGQSCRTAIQGSALSLYAQMMQVNYFTAVRCTLQALPWLIQSQGTVVNIGSLVSKTAWPWVAPYAASKSALASFSTGLRIEMRGQVHCLLVCPGPIARDDAEVRYQDQAAGLDAAANRPGAGAPVKAIDPKWLADRIVTAIQRQERELIVPWKSRLLFLAYAISARLGDWLLGKLSGLKKAD